MNNIQQGFVTCDMLKTQPVPSFGERQRYETPSDPFLCLAKTSYTYKMNDLAKSWIRTFPIGFFIHFKGAPNFGEAQEFGEGQLRA
jgi:hypothetical protein